MRTIRETGLTILGGFALLLSGWGVHLTAQDRPIQARLNPQERFQVIDGFGVNVIGPYFRKEVQSVLDMMIDDLGATMFRVSPYYVCSNWEDTNDNDDPYVMNWEYYSNRYSSPVFEAGWAMMRHLNSRGIRPLVCLYGPVPDWMTDDKTFPPEDPKRVHQNHLSAKMYDEYAEELVSMLLYARREARIDFQYFSPFNETDAYPNEGPRIDPNEAPKVLDAIARRMKREGLDDIKLAPADQANPKRDFFSPILADKELMNQVGAITFHIYNDGQVAAPQVERVHALFPQVPVWVTEYGGTRRSQSYRSERVEGLFARR